MKYTVHFVKDREEEVIVYAHAPSSLTEEIGRLCQADAPELMGYREEEACRLDIRRVCCFSVEESKVWAHTMDGTYRIKQRLYQLEEMYPKDFVKINQSCLANVRRIRKFGTSFGGSLTVTFENGQQDYVSRRNMKTMKERFGL